jgi:hypothetical protein
MDYNSEDPNMPEDDMEEQEDETSMIEEGDFVSFQLEDGSDALARVEYIMSDGSFGIEGSKYNVPASLQDPVLLLRLFNMSADGESETELLTGRKLSEVEVKALPLGLRDQVNEMNVSSILKSVKEIILKHQITEEA